MTCKNCGKKFEGKFCPFCGTKAEEPPEKWERSCPVCGRKRQKGEKFCVGCGHKFSSPPFPGSGDAVSAAGAVGGACAGAAAKLKAVPKKVWIVAGSVLLAVILLLAVLIPVVSCSSQSIRLADAEALSLGDSRARVEELFGEPHWDGGDHIEYYSENYRKLLLKEEELLAELPQDGEELISKLEELAALQEEKGAEEHVRLRISFTAGVITGVELDTVFTDNGGIRYKELKACELLSSKTAAGVAVELPYRAYYTDGSYVLGTARATAETVGATTAHWQDIFGNSCTFPVTADGNGWYLSEDGSQLTVAGDIAFQDNFAAKAASASKVVVLRGTSSVPDQAFAGMTALEEAVIDEGVSYLSPSAFLGCTIRRAELPSHLLPVFPDAPLEEVTVTGTADIYGGEFAGCTSLIKVTLGAGIRMLGYMPFEDCTSLASLNVDENNPVYVSIGNCIVERGTGVLVAGCKASSMPTDGSVRAIGTGAFAGCTGLTSLSIPFTVTEIGQLAFDGCTGLGSVDLPDSVRSIGSWAFRDCTALSSVGFGSGLERIASGAFLGCTSLTAARFANTEGWSVNGTSLDPAEVQDSALMADRLIRQNVYADWVRS